MSLTSEQIASFRTQAGLSPTPPAPTQTGATDIISQRKAALGLDQPATPAPAPSLFSKIASDASSRGTNAEADITSTEGNSNNPFVQGTADLSHGLKAAGEGGMAVADVGADVGKALLSHLGIGNQSGPTTDTSEPADNPVRKAITDTVSGTASKAYDELGIRLNDFVNAHPELGKVLTNILGAGQGAGNVSNGILTGDMAATGAQKAVDLTKQGISAVQDTAATVKSAVSDKVSGLKTPETTDAQKIQEMISPKPTVKEAKIAMDQGRLYKGQEPTMFKAGTEDRIAASDQQIKSGQTIQRLIPNAASMDEPTLYSALDEKIGQTAEALKPEMEATAVKPETVQKINDDWTNLKKTQMAEADATEEPNVKKEQQQFEKRLEKSGNENMNDLWETRKSYDDSVPDSVKKANDLSSDSLQAKKSRWLQNRKILTDAINDSTSGMGKNSQQAFSDMRDMYEGKNGLLTKAKVSTKVLPSKVAQFAKTRTGKIVTHVAKAGLGAIAGKSVGGTTGEVVGGIIGAGL